MKWLDSVLLGAAQRVCDKFQRLTGLTKFRLEKWMAIIAAMLYWMFAIELHSLLLTLISLILSIASFFMVRDIESQEKAFLARNELRYDIAHSRWARIASLVLYGVMLLPMLSLALIASAPELLWLCGWMVSVLAKIYFSACVPQLPSKSKMREWSEKSLLWLRDQLPPAPVPNQ